MQRLQGLLLFSLGNRIALTENVLYLTLLLDASRVQTGLTCNRSRLHWILNCIEFSRHHKAIASSPMTEASALHGLGATIRAFRFGGRKTVQAGREQDRGNHSIL